jgi:hypothetical protein
MKKKTRRRRRRRRRRKIKEGINSRNKVRALHIFEAAR